MQLNEAQYSSISAVNFLDVPGAKLTLRVLARLFSEQSQSLNETHPMKPREIHRSSMLSHFQVSYTRFVAQRSEAGNFLERAYCSLQGQVFA